MTAASIMSATLTPAHAPAMRVRLTFISRCQTHKNNLKKPHAVEGCADWNKVLSSSLMTQACDRLIDYLWTT